MKTVELHSAYIFDCPDCGNENLIHAVECDLEEPIARAIIDGDSQDVLDPQFGAIGREGGTADWIVSRVVVAPPRVRCGYCREEFETELPDGPTVDDQ